MIKFFKSFILMTIVLVSILLVNFTKKEYPKVSSLHDRIESKLSAQGGTYVPLSQIPLPLQQAVIDVEDRSFYANSGVSFEGTMRSVVTDLNNARFQEGGSTITQQLAKNQIVGNERGGKLEHEYANASSCWCFRESCACCREQHGDLPRP